MYSFRVIGAPLSLGWIRIPDHGRPRSLDTDPWTASEHHRRRGCASATRPSHAPALPHDKSDDADLLPSSASRWVWATTTLSAPPLPSHIPLSSTLLAFLLSTTFTSHYNKAHHTSCRHQHQQETEQQQERVSRTCSTKESLSVPNVRVTQPMPPPPRRLATASERESRSFYPAPPPVSCSFCENGSSPREGCGEWVNSTKTDFHKWIQEDDGQGRSYCRQAVDF